MAEQLRVLLVEDSADDAALILRALKKGGYELEHLRVETAAELGAALKRQPWDLILSAYAMPHFNGMEALELALQIRASHPGIRCLFMSGYTADVISSNGLLEQGVNFLAKPFSLPELAAKVRATLA